MATVKMKVQQRNVTLRRFGIAIVDFFGAKLQSLEQLLHPSLINIPARSPPSGSHYL
ncbi:MAG: hypothetical protein HC780_06265 [Leptolyngbyaceae cyanobacterium CSU_1_3]|nr:hypothetical protein [Leptolyngbyaceae cyanobacterium CSU_1_3]